MLRLTAPLAQPAMALATAAAALALAAPAMAAPAAAAPTVLVRLDAADLSASDAATSIHHRIAAAARTVCKAEGRSLQEQMIARQCTAQAIRSAAVQLIAQRQQARGRQPALATAAR